MPPKNSVKLYIENGHYHVYNRGVEKRIIFLDDRDYKTFLHFLKFYLDPEEKTDRHTGIPNRMSLADEISLLAFCLMPNHFHLLVKQTKKDSLTKLMRRISTNYVMHFNKRYQRVGPLFQGIYKAALIDTDDLLLHVHRYIHRNPIELIGGINPISALADYPYSSYGDYVEKRHSAWVQTQPILSYFGKNKALLAKKHQSYEAFVRLDEDGQDDYGSIFIDSEDPN